MKKILISGLYLLILFCIAEFVFAPMYLFYEFWWLDIPMHILGGFGVAIFTSAIFSYFKIKISYKRIFWILIITAITWEFWEYFTGQTEYYDWIGRLDTVKDIINGIIGASIGYHFVKK